MIKVEINGSSLLSADETAKIVRRALGAVKIKDACVSVAFVQSSEIKTWNRRYRKKNKATDILSFGFFKPMGDESGWKRTGELLISTAEAKKNAKEKQIKLRDELKLLLVHGSLHLAGYDHVKGPEARRMKRLEKSILDDLGVKL